MKLICISMLSLFFLISVSASDHTEADLLSRTRQLTFEGKRAGEGYYNADGSKMVFQSERSAENPFYQIFLMDLETGDTEHISPGYGKTTCSWVHPDGSKVLFASTHLDPDARKKQKEELEMRASGKERRYAWDYDETFDLFAKDLESGEIQRLTNAKGYDAEASYSPDGQYIAFSSNRHGYTEKLDPKEKDAFELDPSFMLDLYIMRADGSDLKRLTTTRGYDGGPFFSADGTRICWRRFSEDGATAEIYTMNLDGSDKRQLTKIGAMSWAPYYHPSGDYLIFTTNKHGFANFELYLVDAEGKKEPVRVTFTDGFDGLPVFSPDGKTLAWTNKRAGAGSQIFRAAWNHTKARELLGLTSGDALVSAVDMTQSHDGYDANDLRAHVEALASERMEGRMTGSEGGRMAADYVAGVFKALGLEPAGDNGTWFQEFPFVAGVSLGKKNILQLGETKFETDVDWRPLAFSQTGDIEAADVVFAGYGIEAPAAEGIEEYDSFVHLDVKDKWVLVFRFLPEDIDAKKRQHMNRHVGLRYKAMVARNKGARGLLIANGPNAETKSQLVKLTFDTSLSGTSIPALSISDKVLTALFEGSGKDPAALQAQLDKGEMVMGFPLEGKKLSSTVEIIREQRKGQNILARLNRGDKDGPSALAIGAHVDHLGRGEGGGSLARDDEQNAIHYGADDNASGVAGLLEIAQYLATQKKAGKLKMEHDVLFAAWSGEELGLLGSDYFADTYGGKKESDPLSPAIIAYLNMDMIGRLNENLVIQGLGSSPVWAGEVERRNAPVGLPIVTQQDSYLPTDATSFFLKEVPILSAFTGSHSDYHTPRDTAEKLDYDSMKDISRFMGLIARGLLKNPEIPKYQAMKKPESSGRRAVMRAYLGTIPDYAQGDIKGLKLSGVSADGPAQKAGMRGGDIIISLAGKKIENIYDYTYAIEALKIGEAVAVIVKRDGKDVTMELVPGSRQ